MKIKKNVNFGTKIKYIKVHVRTKELFCRPNLNCFTVIFVGIKFDVAVLKG